MTTNLLLLLVGVVVLVINVVFITIRAWRGRWRANAIHVGLMLVACVLITPGVIRVTFPALSSTAIEKPSESAELAAASNGQPVLTGALSGSTSPRPAASTALGIPASSSNAAALSAASTSAPIPLVIIVGGLVFAAGAILFLKERRQSGFEPSASPGLLCVGAGVFVLVVTLVVPILPGQFGVASASTGLRVAASGMPANNSRAAHPALATTTPSGTPAPSQTPTVLPSLTPMPGESPSAQFTAIAYAHNTSVSTGTNCSVTAQTMINLRGDPSVQQQAIGKVFAGSLLPVTGQSADKKWWRVNSSDGTTSIEGWVSADYVTVGTGCTDGSIPLIAPTQTPTRTIAPTQTPRPSATPRS